MVKPIFVVGSSRSGTTMIGRVLNQHGLIRTFPELHFFEQMCDIKDLKNSFGTREATMLMDRLIGTMEEGFLHYRSRGKYIKKAELWIDEIQESLSPKYIFLKFLEKYSNEMNADFACDQTPRNVLFMQVILDMYPEARVVAMVRDPRSVLVSQKKKWKRKFLGASTIPLRESLRSYFNYHPYTISRLWQASIDAIDKYKDHPRVTVVKYEDVVNNPEEIIQGLCEFLGVNYSAEMLQVPQVGSSSGHDNPKSEVGITSRSIRTRFDDVLSNGELYICENNTMSSMQFYGYEPSQFKNVPWFQLFAYLLLFPVKMCIALMLNIRRMKNIKDSILRRMSLA